ncbi:hypothetical protein Tco_0103218 [Tanacetum coccineum]
MIKIIIMKTQCMLEHALHEMIEKHDNDEVADEEKADEEMPQGKRMKRWLIVLISVTQKEKPKLPPTRSSLSLSSGNGNQFLNVSSDVSFVVIVKEITDTEINSLLERTIRDVLKKYPPTLLKSSTSSTSIDSFTEYELKNMLYNKMQKCRLYHTHEKHLDIYNVLIGSIGLDEAIAKGEIDGTKVLKKRRHDDKDEDPPTDSEKKKQK